SREASQRGFFPAIDPLASLSRVQPGIVDPWHFDAANEVRAHLKRYREVEDLIRMGAYVSGADPAVDESVHLYPRIEAFVRQGRDECCDFSKTLQGLKALADDAPAVTAGGIQ